MNQQMLLVVAVVLASTSCMAQQSRADSLGSLLNAVEVLRAEVSQSRTRVDSLASASSDPENALEVSRLAVESIKDSNDTLRVLLIVVFAVPVLALLGMFGALYRKVAGHVEWVVERTVESHFEVLIGRHLDEASDKVLRTLGVQIFERQTSYSTEEIPFTTAIMAVETGQYQQALERFADAIQASPWLKRTFDPDKERLEPPSDWEAAILAEPHWGPKYRELYHEQPTE